MKICRIFVVLGFFALSLGGLSAQTAEPTVSAATDDLTKFDSADALWAHVQALEKGPATKPKSKEEFAAFLTTLNSAATEFLKKYPEDKREWTAKMLKVQSGSILARLGQPGFEKADAVALAKEVAEAKDAPDEVKKDADFFLLTQALQADPQNVEKTMATYQKKHPEDDRVDEIRFSFAQRLAEKNPAKAAAVYKELSGSKNEQVAQAAKAMVQAAEMVGKPVDLKFTAVNGEEVDLGKMAGKVVLIDFWATWCGPCMQEVPNVVATYSKYHDKGFEIVGISLDQDKDKLLEVTREKGMTWPQYFDGKGWKNEISQRFGINSIPRMWLINKKGVLVTTEAREDLEGQVEKLLAD